MMHHVDQFFKKKKAFHSSILQGKDIDAILMHPMLSHDLPLETNISVKSTNSDKQEVIFLVNINGEASNLVNTLNSFLKEQIWKITKMTASHMTPSQ